MYATRSKKVKTDKRDARTLCEACRLGAYHPAHRTSDKQRDVRAHLAVRETLVRTRSKYISLIGALARREGCRIKSLGLRQEIERAEPAGDGLLLVLAGVFRRQSPGSGDEDYRALDGSGLRSQLDGFL